MGAEMTHRTRKALLDAVRTRALEVLDESLEADKDAEPVPPRRAGDSRGAASRARSNAASTTRTSSTPRPTSRTPSSRSSARRRWSARATSPPGPDPEHRAEHPGPERARGRAAPGVVRGALERGERRHRRGHRRRSSATTRLYTPFEVYAKALQEFFRGHELTASEWDETRSKMFPQLDRYQKEAYWALMKIARQHGGAFLCDGVGLGKTFVGLMLIERLVLHEGKRVVLFAPKAAKEGVSGSRTCASGCRTSAVSAAAPTSATWRSSATPTWAARATSPSGSSGSPSWPTSVIIDEAHHFRNPGRQGDGDDGSSRRATTSCTTCSTTRFGRRRSSCSPRRRSTTG